MHFLEEQRTPATLILGGDIFDLWLGAHPYFKNKFKTIVEKITKLVRSGHTIYYFEGNHDLHLKPFWQDQLGVKVYSDPEFFLFDGVVVRFEHGDQMNPEDRGYHFLRWFLRTPPLRWLILHLPSWLVSAIGNKASQMSRQYTDGLRDEDKIREFMRDHVHRVFEQRPFDVVVHGHVHLRDDYTFEQDAKKVRSFNLGSWDHDSRILRFEHGKWSWLDLT